MLDSPGTLHFISIGSPGMLELAMAVTRLGYTVTASEDGLSGSRRDALVESGLMPARQGWFADNVNSSLKAVVAGSGVKSDNPEILQAQALGLNVYTIPDIVRHFSADKQRMVIIGSGKRLISDLIVHTMRFHHRSFDFLVSGKNGISLSDAPLIVIEGQDEPANFTDPAPDFRRYDHHIAVVSDLDWMPSTTYPVKESYVAEFDLFQKATPKGGVLIYSELDPVVSKLCQGDRPDQLVVAYKAHDSVRRDNQDYLVTSNKNQLSFHLSGPHTLRNISAAKEALKKVGITSEMFYQAIGSFDAKA